MFLPQQVIKKFIIFELITKTTPRPERKSCSILKAMAKEKRLSVLMRKSQSLTPGKNIVPLTLKVQLTLSKKKPLWSAESCTPSSVSLVKRPEAILKGLEDQPNCPLTIVRGNEGEQGWRHGSRRLCQDLRKIEKTKERQGWRRRKRAFGKNGLD